MTSLSRTAAAIALAAMASASLLHAVDVWTVGVNNTRQGWNRFETILTPANVPRLKKTREFTVDEKIDVSPLVVGDKLYVFTMTNTAYVFDVKPERRSRCDNSPRPSTRGPTRARWIVGSSIAAGESPRRR